METIVAPGCIGPWKSHRKKWGKCTLCPLGKSANTHVLFRGHLPCQVLFIGEAPGEQEDLQGFPFVGRSGVLLDRIIQHLSQDFPHFTFAITNILACRPPGNATPTPSQIEACLPRVRQFIELARPQLIVLMGTTAARALRKKDTGQIPTLKIQHPAYMLRTGGFTSLACKKAVVYLKQYLKRYL